MNRRGFVLSSLVMITAGTSRAQSLPVASPSPKPFALFNEHGALTDQLTPEQHAEVQLDSPAPAGSPGRWVTRASLPTPTSEMGGGATWGERLRVVGGWIVPYPALTSTMLWAIAGSALPLCRVQATISRLRRMRGASTHWAASRGRTSMPSPTSMPTRSIRTDGCRRRPYRVPAAPAAPQF